MEPPATFAPRLVRQGLQRPPDRHIEVAALGRRTVAALGDRIAVADPKTGAVYATEAVPGEVLTALDPRGRYVCLAGVDRAKRAYVAAFDLMTRSERWRKQLASGSQPLNAAASVAHCWALVRKDQRVSLLGFATADGGKAPVQEKAQSMVLGAPGSRGFWDPGLRYRFDMRWAKPDGSSESGWYVEVRDGQTMEKVANLWARCFEYRDRVLHANFHPTEKAGNRSYYKQELPVTWGDCKAATPPPTSSDETQDKVLPYPWVPLPDGRLAHHNESGLYVWQWADGKPARRLSETPALRYTDVDGVSRALDPVVAHDGSWIGAISAKGRLQRWATDSAAKLPEIKLPKSKPGRRPGQARWQIFAGADDHLAVIRDTKKARQIYVGHAAKKRVRWRRARAKVMRDLTQHLQWLARDGGRWLASDPNYGTYLLDPARGKRRGAFRPPPMYARNSTPAVSPDGTQAAVFVGEWPSDKAAGMYVLDTADLSVARKWPWPGKSRSVFDWAHWNADGLVFSRVHALFSNTAWTRVDPTSGKASALDQNSPARFSRGYRRTGQLHVHLGVDREALVGSRIDVVDARVRIVDAKGSYVQRADGQVWCHGSGCEQFRCAVALDQLEPATHPACAAKLTVAK